MEEHNKREARGFKREEGMPKNGLSEDLNYRIKGLEQAKTFPEMSRADIAALDRMINKLKQKLADQAAPKVQQEE
ncbi:MAG TPA: hypothetical protein VFX17_03210 [Patescibacteria group bacterium]|nr:hypothetical protein [Patescibacteria group bacterium]